MSNKSQGEIKQNGKNCKHVTCQGLCRREKKPKKQHKVNKVSEKMQAAKEIYTPKAAAYVQAHPECVIRSEVCTYYTTCVHHPKGKATIALLLDDSLWMPVCYPCNLFIESHSALAYERGWKFSKFRKE
jgi:hypothetical protein